MTITITWQRLSGMRLSAADLLAEWEKHKDYANGASRRQKESGPRLLQAKCEDIISDQRFGWAYAKLLLFPLDELNAIQSRCCISESIPRQACTRLLYPERALAGRSQCCYFCWTVMYS